MHRAGQRVIVVGGTSREADLAPAFRDAVAPTKTMLPRPARFIGLGGDLDVVAALEGKLIYLELKSSPPSTSPKER